MDNSYRYALSVTSQFFYCNLPLRLDSYSRCQFNCAYCFANARGGDRGVRRFKTANVIAFQSRLSRVMSGSVNSVTDEFLSKRQPIHFGGMSDPFMPAEESRFCTLEMLNVLADHKYPTVLSTKSDALITDAYLEVLKRGRFLIQISVSTMDDVLLRRVDYGVPSASFRLALAKTLIREGIPCSCRIQPLLPTRERDAIDVIDHFSSVGVRHFAIEHLKLPIERDWIGTRVLSSALGQDIPQFFANRKAIRIGREWVLPVFDRLDRILLLREYVHAKTCTFGAADNDLLLLSDGKCCCSGADIIAGFADPFSFNYTEAARRGIATNVIAMSNLHNVWSPVRSIAMYVNSHSRIRKEKGRGAGIRDYIRNGWNSGTSENSPAAFFGVVAMNSKDAEGFVRYGFTPEVRALLAH